MIHESDAVHGFEKWMLKIGNIYRNNHDQMAKAHIRVTPLKYNPGYHITSGSK